MFKIALMKLLLCIFHTKCASKDIFDNFVKYCNTKLGVCLWEKP